MTILFSGAVSTRHQDRLQADFPTETFIFRDTMTEAQPFLSEAKVLVTYGEDLTPELMGQAVQLEWIMVMSAGLERMPFKAIEEKQVRVTNARGIHKVPMGEYTISMLLQTYRQEKLISENEGNQIWDKTVRVKEITGKTILIVGAGAIGEEIARLAKAFQMKTWGISRSGRSVKHFDVNEPMENLHTLLPDADFIVSVLPSTVETQHVFTEKEFKLMSEQAVFMNIGRGQAVKSEDLLIAIQQEEIAHAILDVFETEPLPAEHPFWLEKNITVTPHISGVSSEYVTRALEIFTENLRVYQAEENTYLNEIDTNRGY
ncbi:MAG TPA: D-2-hydroxyacid dehydrogenase [Virgibacillus sp.]|nr:D-2-hydroxyacid dehydrogenase [Virgibacillus sp.]